MTFFSFTRCAFPSRNVNNTENSEGGKKHIDSAAVKDIGEKIDRKLIKPYNNLKFNRKDLEKLIKGLRVVDQLIKDLNDSSGNNQEFTSYEARKGSKEYSFRRFWDFNFLKKYAFFQGGHRKVLNKISSRYSCNVAKEQHDDESLEVFFLKELKEKKDTIIKLIKDKSK